jgi:G3E family GTPase
MLSQLHSIIPPAVLADTGEAAAKLLPAILMRVNFIPGVRHRLGWRGVKECQPEGLSAKIAGQDGVYGVVLADRKENPKWGEATFNIYYFPSPDEETLESFSVAACIAALQDGYLEQVRSFTDHEKLKTLFHIARLSVRVNSKNTNVTLTLRATDHLVLISADGVKVTRENQEEEVIAPGGIDQDLPALNIAHSFFRIIAASCSFCLGATPTHLQRKSRTATKYIYFQDNRVEQHPLPEAKETALSLSWGETPTCVEKTDGAFETELLWQDPATYPLEYADEPWWHEHVPGARFSVDKSAMGITERPKLIILTGFLGSGKTSFLNHFIEYQAERNAFVAIVQNEIGAKNLDTHLLGQHYAVTEMDEGCICCTLAGSLKLALSEIVSGFQPDFVVVETTGLANPANFLHEVSELEDQLDFCSITTVIDASQGMAVLQKYGVAREQVILADVILLNKIDTIPPVELTTLTEDIQKLNPLATIHHGHHGDFSAPQLYGVNLTGHIGLNDSLKQMSATQHHTHSSHNISSTLVELKSPLDKDTFLSRTANLPDKVLRIKGIMQFTDNEKRFYYQYVPGSHSLTPAGENLPDENFLVIIGEEIKESAQSLLEMTAT